MRMASEGHLVCNHTYSHKNLVGQKGALESELRQLEETVMKCAGVRVANYFRPPEGKFDMDLLDEASALGYRTVFWSLAYVDWNNDSQPTAEQAYSKLLPRIHNGAVVLLHSTSKTNAQILDDLLTKWEAMGYTFAPISALFA